jgi:hypothetical protein
MSIAMRELGRATFVLCLGGLVACAKGFSGEEEYQARGAALSPSNFESADGNLDSTGGSHTDWANVTGLTSKSDLASGGDDNAFGQGSKEDSPNVSVVRGSIPPQKSDLTRFYVAHENLNGEFFLYLAWERTNELGSANMDFEFNQATQTLSAASVGAVTINRTAGDLLVTYDFGGSGAPTLGILRWLTAGAGNTKSQCFSANALPCWGNRVDLSASGFADGAVNASTVTDSLGGTPVDLGPNRFGEAAINLSKAGPNGTSIFPPGQCVNFASAFLKSRSSSSFTAELKDFVAPANANISNCGGISIHKTDGTNALAGAGFTLYSGATPSGTACTGGTTVGTCVTNASGDCNFGSNIPWGTYCVAETTTPANYFTANAQSATISPSSNAVTLEFVDVKMPGALQITKTGTNGAALAGAVFTVKDKNDNLVGTSYTTDANGHVCVTGLNVGDTYTVTETAAPANYSIDTTSKSVSITAPAPDCSSGSGAAQVGFTNSPYSAISCNFTSSAGANVTAATIQCTGDNGVSSFTTKSMTNLVPGTYNCTFVITSPSP